MIVTMDGKIQKWYQALCLHPNTPALSTTLGTDWAFQHVL